MPPTSTQKLNHTKNRHKVLCDKKAAMTELLLQLITKLTKVIHNLDKKISAAEEEIERIQKP